MVYRIFVEKRKELAHEANSLKKDITSLLQMKNVEDVRVINRYDVENISEELASLGFDISSLGGGTFFLNGVPAELDGLSPVNLLIEVVHSVMEQTDDVKEKLQDKIALSMAKEVAIIVGQLLSQEEVNTLIDNLFTSSMPSRTPDGLPITYVMSDNEIDKNFCR